jgi:hypothetical protein
MKLALIAFSALVLGACGVSGHYRGQGPCRGFHKDQQACERAHANSLGMAKVQIGQTTAEVAALMGGGPDRRDATADCETWSYLTHYQARTTTTVIFRKGLVSEIRSGGGRC